MSIIDKLREAVHSGEIIYPFSQSDFNKWFSAVQLKKDSGEDYGDTSKFCYANSLASSTTGKKQLRLIEGSSPQKFILEEDVRLIQLFKKITE
ncbi:hypothetical protein [Turicibacter sanguinis]|uniref:hypothetical protein n=1 Tax=Turicibacter sanguinis TaxID=154288 RepID=UPI0018A9DA80|nr:hypothetical protein [Turicibacter sanguinis]MDB8553020.1 hypothetical protein [Turicibacter sanguinis]